MHPRTLATLDQLREADWFSTVGVNDTETAIVVGSWDDAISLCAMDDWQDLLLEAANQYCSRLAERSPSRFGAWNDVVAQVKLATVPLVEERTSSVVAANNLPKVFVHTVQWDVLHVCMEAEYADVFPPGFFASQAYWYVKGHFPCGWDGKFPEGRIIVY
ncbi:MAG: hypothetical protein MUF84_18445 [Anaerolineae bacterium]|jgi:hypothetical protein|nr:hypothetical protein [Anaerolineae bacterium]